MRPAGRGALSKPLGAMGRPYWGAVFVSLLCLIRPASAGRCACLFRYRRHWRRITDGAQRRGALVARIEWQSVGLLKNVGGKYGGMVNHKYRPELSARRPRSAGKAPPAIPGGWQAGFTLPPWHWLTAPYTFRPLFPFRATAASACNCSPRWVWRGLPLDGRQGGTRRAGGGCRDQCRASGAACVSGFKERGKGKARAKPGKPGALRVSAKDRTNNRYWIRVSQQKSRTN